MPRSLTGDSQSALALTKETADGIHELVEKLAERLLSR